MDNDSKLLFEAYSKFKTSYTPVDSDYIYFLDDEELYQTNPMKRIGTGEKYLKQAFPNGYKKVRVTVGEEIHDIVPGNNIDLGTQSDKLFVVDGTFPKESSFPALISTSSEDAEETDNQEYEDELDKKEAYKNSLLRQDEEPCDSEDAQDVDPLISMLERKGRSSSANETQQEINNIAQKCHTLLTGGGAGKYSGIKLNNKQRQVLSQIGQLVLTI